jgi:hypothetical protein
VGAGFAELTVVDEDTEKISEPIWMTALKKSGGLRKAFTHPTQTSAKQSCQYRCDDRDRTHRYG